MNTTTLVSLKERNTCVLAESRKWLKLKSFSVSGWDRSAD